MKEKIKSVNKKRAQEEFTEIQAKKAKKAKKAEPATTKVGEFGETVSFALDAKFAEIAKRTQNQPSTEKMPYLSSIDEESTNIMVATNTQTKQDSELINDAKKFLRFMQNEMGISYNHIGKAYEELWNEQTHYPENIQVLFTDKNGKTEIVLGCYAENGKFQRLDNQEIEELPANLKDIHHSKTENMVFYTNDKYNDEYAGSDVSKMIGKAVYKVSEFQKLNQLKEPRKYVSKLSGDLILLNMRTDSNVSNKTTIRDDHLKVMAQAFGENKGAMTVANYVGLQTIINEQFAKLEHRAKLDQGRNRQ